MKNYEELPFDYRIKKCIQRAHPIEFIELLNGCYRWSCDGQLLTLSDLVAMAEIGGQEQRTTALIDKGRVALLQIEDYIRWFSSEGVDDFMMTGKVPFPPMPDWLLWHELKRLQDLKGDQDIQGFVRGVIAHLYPLINTYPLREQGWLLHSSTVYDYFLTHSLVSEKIKRGDNVVTHANFGDVGSGARSSCRSEDNLHSQRRTPQSADLWPIDTGR